MATASALARSPAPTGVALPCSQGAPARGVPSWAPIAPWRRARGTAAAWHARRIIAGAGRGPATGLAAPDPGRRAMVRAGRGLTGARTPLYQIRRGRVDGQVRARHRRRG